jgi:hypothetical protein
MRAVSVCTQGTSLAVLALKRLVMKTALQRLKFVMATLPAVGSFQIGQVVMQLVGQKVADIDPLLALLATNQTASRFNYRSQVCLKLA